jgi:flavodoxin
LKEIVKVDFSMSSLLVIVSYHHNNTQKIAEVFARVLDAKIKTPTEITADELQQLELLGFGSGIYFGKHHKDLLKFADRISKVDNKKAFIFSTSGDGRGIRSHTRLRKKLESKGYKVVDEFSCAGFDTFGLMKLVGGIKKGRPNAGDLEQAEEFAKKLRVQP